MKKILVIICLLFGLIGCDKILDMDRDDTKTTHKVIVIDSCEYIFYNTHLAYEGPSIAHKGNCKFCAERQNKRDKEFLKILKGR